MATVTTYKSPDDLATALGLVVVSGLDESGVQVNYAAGDLVLTSGGDYTIVKAVIPVTTQIVQKGIFYTVINSL